MAGISGVTDLKIVAEGRAFRVTCDAEAVAVPKLIARLQSAGIRDLLVEAASLEEAFMSYYGDAHDVVADIPTLPYAPATSAVKRATKRVRRTPAATPTRAAKRGAKRPVKRPAKRASR